MKKILLFALFVSFYSNAQNLTSFDKIGDNVQIIKGAIATIDSQEQISLKNYGFEKLFYKDKDFINIYEPLINKYLSEGKEVKLSVTKYDNVVSKDFNVLDAIKMPQFGIYNIVLKTPESEIIYYRYDSSLKDKQPLKIKSTLVFPEVKTTQANTIEEVKADVNVQEATKDLCSDVEITTDKFTGEITYNSPDIDNISFVKSKKKGTTYQYVSISIYNSLFKLV